MTAIPDEVFAEAVAHFWAARGAAGVRQRESRSVDQGNRQEVTSGGHLDGFLNTIEDLVTLEGLARPSEVRRGRRLSVLPGYYRPEKEWDLVIVKGGALAAAIELKAQVGPSFGNNFNNRSEEALGTAEDIWAAYREGAFGSQPAPWLGYLFLLEDSPASQRPVRLTEANFDVFPEFRNASYAGRYELLLRRMMLERRYTATALILSPRPDPGGHVSYSEPALDLRGSEFLRSLVGHLSGLPDSSS